LHDFFRRFGSLIAIMIPVRNPRLST
jgi:hypothetical protein